MKLARAIAADLAGTRRGFRRSLVMAALAALLLAVAAVPAHAGVRTASAIGSWIRLDDFEGNPQNRWTIQGDGHFSHHPQWANSGSEYAYLRTNGSVSSFVRTTFYLPSRTMRGCTASVAVRAVTKDAYVGLLVWDPGNPVGAVYPFVTVRPGEGWRRISATGVPFQWGRETEAVISLLGHRQPGTGVTDIRVDDFTFQCWI